MPLYLVTPFADPDALARGVEDAISEHDRYLLKSGGWLIRFDGTSRELSDKIGITNATQNPVGSALVVGVAGYYGKAPNDMWEWIKTRLEQ